LTETAARPADAPAEKRSERTAYCALRSPRPNGAMQSAQPAEGRHAEAPWAESDKKDSTVTLKITDKASGFKLEATKQVAADTRAFDFLRHTVAVTYKTDVDGAPIVTGLCGVTPARGHGWTCTIGGKPCNHVGSVSITKDRTIEWPTEKYPPAGSVSSRRS